MEGKLDPTYIAYVIRIPQQDNPIYNEMFSNECYDHFYESTEIIVPWIYEAKFYLTRKDARKQWEKLRKSESTLIADIKEVRLNLYDNIIKFDK